MAKDWERVRGVIINYYYDQKMPLKEVMRIMERSYSFKASTRSYRQKFKEWDVTKYSRRTADSASPSVNSLASSGSRSQRRGYHHQYSHDQQGQQSVQQSNLLQPNGIPRYDTSPTRMTSPPGPGWHSTGGQRRLSSSSRTYLPPNSSNQDSLEQWITGSSGEGGQGFSSPMPPASSMMDTTTGYVVRSSNTTTLALPPQPLSNSPNSDQLPYSPLSTPAYQTSQNANYHPWGSDHRAETAYASPHWRSSAVSQLDPQQVPATPTQQRNWPVQSDQGSSYLQPNGYQGLEDSARPWYR